MKGSARSVCTLVLSRTAGNVSGSCQLLLYFSLVSQLIWDDMLSDCTSVTLKLLFFTVAAYASIKINRSDICTRPQCYLYF